MEYAVLDMEATGARIKELREKNHIPVRAIADHMGFNSEQAIYKWQRGESLPTLDNIFALSKLFGTTVDDILIEKKERGGDTPLLPFLKDFEQTDDTFLCA